MNKTEETIGFLQMLKGLNKTKVEIDLILPMLLEMQKEAINYTHCCEELKDKEKLSYSEWLKDNNFVKFSNLLYKKENEEWFLAKVVKEYNAYAESL